MDRGYLNNILRNEVYQKTNKQWYIELVRSDIFWYDLIVNKHDEVDTKKIITKMIHNLKVIVENELDKRFIYFIASRKKLRFSLKYKPKYSIFNNKLILYIEVGRERKIKKIAIHVLDMKTERVIKPRVAVSDRFITFLYDNGDKLTYSIHDFLLNISFEMGLHTEIHYVGFTKNPQTRPIDGSHSGLSNTLYSLSKEDNDIFICYNLFKVITVATNEKFTNNFFMANSMIDEIKIDNV